MEARKPTERSGRYVVHDELASGGMATVHIGRLLGPVGFARTVAIKRLLPSLSKDPDFVSMFLDEARLAARIRHPNVVSTFDVVSADGDLLLVMEYVEGESLARLVRAAREQGERVPPAIAAAVGADMLYGLHAAHEATADGGEPLCLVHRDVSPQNVMVGVDGVARVVDFGIAKAAGRMQPTTREGQVKGKIAYMAPEQLRGTAVNRQADVYAASVILWELLAGERLFDGDNEGSVVEKVLFGRVDPPSRHAPDLPPEIDAVVLRGLSRERTARFATAREMAVALDRCLPRAAPPEVGDWVRLLADDELAARRRRVAEVVERERRLPSEGATGRTIGPARPDRRVAVVAAVAATAGGLLLLGFHQHSAPHGATPEAASIAPEPEERPTATGVPEAVVAAAPESSDGAAAPGPAAPDPTAPAARSTVRREPSRSVRRPPSSCDPPYTYDDKGRRIWKRECL